MASSFPTWRIVCPGAITSTKDYFPLNAGTVHIEVGGDNRTRALIALVRDHCNGDYHCARRVALGKHRLERIDNTLTVIER